MPVKGYNLLSDDVVRTQRIPGRYCDGDRLYLIVQQNGYRRWAFRFSRNGREREAGLGSPDGEHPVPLADARHAADRLREKLKAGRSPVLPRDARQRMRETRVGKEGDKPIPTFAAYARYYAKARAPWRNHLPQSNQWFRQMRQISRDLLSRKPVTEVNSADVLRVVRSLSRGDTSRAEHVRSALEEVLNAAYEDLGVKRPNPARALRNVTRFFPRKDFETSAEPDPSSGKSTSVPGKLGQAEAEARGGSVSPQVMELRKFVERLRLQRTTLARSLEFAVLTALHPRDVLALKWSDLSYMRRCLSFTPHGSAGSLDVPLGERPMKIIWWLKRRSPDHWLFGSRRDRSGATIYQPVLTKSGIGNIHINSFRRLFGEWAAAMGHDFGIAAARYLAATDSAVPLQQRAEMRMGKEVEALLVAWDQFLASP